MNTLAPTKSENKTKPSQVLGGILGGFDEIGFEAEASLNSVRKGVGGIVADLFSLGQDVVGAETKSENNEQVKFPPQGTIEFNKAQAKFEKDQKESEVAASKRIFFQTLKDEVARVENSRDRMIYEEEIADIGAHISTEEKNDLLHYQKSYKDRSVYQMAELRRKIIEQRAKSEKEKKQASMAQTQNKVSALNAAMEGGSGSQGGGMANLSATGGGAG